MTQITYSEYVQLRKGEAPPPDNHASGVRVYADTDGTLHTLQSDGTDAEVGSGGGGSTPGPVLDPVQVATAADVALTGLQTIDGYTLQAGDRILVIRQTDQTENGIYLAASGAWSRADDALTVSDMQNKLVYTGDFASGTLTTLYLEASFDPNADYVYFYPVIPLFNFNVPDVSDPTGTLQFYASAFIASTQFGNGLMWTPGGGTYGDAWVGRTVGAWEAAEDGTERFGAVAVPDDATIQTGQRADWYDATIGKAVRRFKGKDAAGTAYSGVSLGSTGNQDTVGAAGGASALPATPSHYIKIRDVNGDLWVVPAYAAS